MAWEMGSICSAVPPTTKAVGLTVQPESGPGSSRPAMMSALIIESIAKCMLRLLLRDGTENRLDRVDANDLPDDGFWFGAGSRGWRSRFIAQDMERILHAGQDGQKEAERVFSWYGLDG